VYDTLDGGFMVLLLQDFVMNCKSCIEHNNDREKKIFP